MYKKSLAAKEETRGHDHMSTLTAVNNLAVLLHTVANQLEDETAKAAKMEEAIAMLKRAFVGYKRALGPLHTQTANIFFNYTTMLFNAGGDYTEQSIDVTKKLLASAVTTLEEQPEAESLPQIQPIAAHLIRLLDAMQRTDEAEDLRKRYHL